MQELSATAYLNLKIVREAVHAAFIIVAGAMVAVCVTATNAWAASGDALASCDNPSLALNAQSTRESLPALYEEGALKISIDRAKYFNGKASKPKATLRLNGEKLQLGTDFRIVCKNASGRNVTPKNVGAYKAVIKGMGIFEGAITKDFTIKKNALFVQGKGFKISLPERWRGKVSVGKVTKDHCGYSGMYGFTVLTRDGEANVMSFICGPSKLAKRYGLMADYPIVAERTSKNRTMWVLTATWSLAFDWGSTMYKWSTKDANTVSNLMTGGKIKNAAQYKAQRKHIDEYVKKYAKKSILSRAVVQ